MTLPNHFAMRINEMDIRREKKSDFICLLQKKITESKHDMFEYFDRCLENCLKIHNIQVRCTIC